MRQRCGREVFFMTDKELKKLNKRELLELLAAMREEIDALRVENEALRRTIAGGEGDLLSATAMRVKKLYEERFGAPSPKRRARKSERYEPYERQT